MNNNKSPEMLAPNACNAPKKSDRQATRQLKQIAVQLYEKERRNGRPFKIIVDNRFGQAG